MVSNSVRSIKIVGHSDGRGSRHGVKGSSNTSHSGQRASATDWNNTDFYGSGSSKLAVLLNHPMLWAAVLLILSGAVIMLAGCGAGGYAGGGVTSLSKSSVTIDAGQSFTVAATSSGSSPVAWNLTGATCSGASCGALSSTDSGGATYTAPSGITSPLKLTLTAGIAGTSNQQAVAITVNPDPTINAGLPGGTVGTAYTATLTATGGTAPLKAVSVTGTLPAGLSFNSTTGVISGTPTTTGTFNFTATVVDSSDVPYTASIPETITISTSVVVTITLSGAPPAATVGTAYTTTLSASGGTGPYTYSLASGSLPAGLTLSTGGVITGTPTTTGTSNFTAQVKDANNVTATKPFSIAVAAGVPTLTITTGGLPNGTAGTPYSAPIPITGGTPGYTCTLTGGTLPAGLTLSAGCVVSGTPTTPGTSTVTVKVTDSGSPTQTTTGTVTITINPAALTLTTGTLPNGTVGTPYSTIIGVTGGSAPYGCVITSGTLPAGLALGPNCLVSGTPTTAGTVTVQVKATDSGSPAQTVTGPETITINPAGLVITTGTLPNGTVGIPYSSTIGASGGTAPYSCAITSGTLPAGLTLAANCAVTGTPTTAGMSTLTVKVTDSASPAQTATGPVTITINPAPLTITTGTLPNGTVLSPYSSTIGVSGGTAPYSCTIVSGTLPTGLVLGPNCLVSGIPLLAGTSNLTVKVTDSASQTVTGPVSITINPLALTISIGVLAPGTVGVPYSAPIGITGGVGPYNCALVSGTLPAGLTLNANCTVTGTPTAPGTVQITVKVVDTALVTVTGTVTITINPATLGITPGGLPNGTVNTPYSATIPVTGGTGPYGCSIVTGTLPAGLSLGAGCVVSGTPTTAGTSNLTVSATDSGTPAQTATGAISITINPSSLTLTTTSLPNGTVGTPYTGTVGVTGGTAPYHCVVTSGTLPAGLAFGAGCTVSGTPTVAGTSQLTVQATDSGSPAQSVSGPQTIVISAAGPTLVISTPPTGTVGTPYTGTIPVSGGTGPYSCTINSGSLPAGLTLGANCSITGTPTTAGPSTVNVTATDSSSPAATTTGPATITINAATPTLTLSNPADPTVGTPYTGTIPVSGGTAPYSCSIISGTLPAGLTLGANCTISGTPTTAGPSTITVTATDSHSPQGTVTGPVTITVQPVPPLTFTGSLPNATLGLPYTQTLAAAGGIGPYTYAVTAGTLPPGITLSTAGVVSGTPTAVGASSFTVTATDSEGTPQTKALPLVLLVVYPVTPYDPAFKGPYAYLFQGYDDVLLGVLSYQTGTVGSFTADGAGVVNLGEQDSNHQASASTTNTIASNTFVGTYTIGADYRGSLAITPLNADGTTALTHIYAIALKAPATAGAASQRATMVESDANQLIGTKGSGTILAQTPASFTTGLTGSYAFGLSGDTPCIVSCAVNLAAGPVAAVGQFTLNGSGAISTGEADSNTGAVNVANSTLSGLYGSADGNGRLDLTMNTSGVASTYPTDYAVYMVDANNAFVLSTDKHSDFSLLAGTLQSQAGTFNNASFSGPFIGYENSPTNPGLVGATLQNVLNLSTATVFRTTGASSGTCNTTNVEQGGVTGLVNGLTGLGSGSDILNALLGTYASTGTSACTVASNGRGVLAYPAPSGLLPTVLALLHLSGNPPAPRVAYLTSPNSGYFLETGYAGLGHIEAQVGAPFSLATFNGTYLYGSAPASTVASIDTGGEIVADGNGHATTTSDLSIGVGTLNVIQLGAGGTLNYTLTNATQGRYTSGTTVIYAISPTHFVSIDTNPLTTSPSVALLY